MKLAFSGKGGVGKTTLAALFAKFFESKGKKVLAVDCDPDSNLASALGFGDEVIPISEMKELICQRMEVQDSNQALYKLNPKIDDIPQRFLKKSGNLYLMAMGTVEAGGGGCVCAESAFLRNLLNHLFLSSQDCLIMDMEAGIEHLGRSTAQSVDILVVVVEPSPFSINTLKKITKLAPQIGLHNIKVIANKLRSLQDKRFIEKNLGPQMLVGSFAYRQELSNSMCGGFKDNSQLIKEVTRIADYFEEELTHEQKK